MKRKYDVNDNYFDTIDNQNKAYILGFLYADGCNYDERGCFKIDLQEEDRYMLEIFKKELEFQGNITCSFKGGYKKFGKEEFLCKPCYGLSIYSKQLSKQLSLKGCVSNKSNIMTFPNENILPRELQRHFIRGFMDGNGTINYWIDNKTTNHKKFGLSFCGTTEIVNSICNIIDNKFDTHSSICSRFPDRDNNNVQSNINGNRNIEKILNWIYKDANLYLDRKYNKYLLLLEQNKITDEDKTLYGFLKPRRPIIRLCDKLKYESMSECSRQTGICKSQLTKFCRNKDGFMYLDEYSKEDSNVR